MRHTHHGFLSKSRKPRRTFQTGSVLTRDFKVSNRKIPHRKFNPVVWIWYQLESWWPLDSELPWTSTTNTTANLIRIRRAQDRSHAVPTNHPMQLNTTRTQQVRRPLGHKDRGMRYRMRSSFLILSSNDVASMLFLPPALPPPVLGHSRTQWIPKYVVRPSHNICVNKCVTKSGFGFTSGSPMVDAPV